MSVYTVPCLWHIKQPTEEKERQGTGAILYTALWVFRFERIERDYPHVYGTLNNKQRRRNVKVLAQYAALFEKVVACVCVCECEACVDVKRV